MLSIVASAIGLIGSLVSWLSSYSQRKAGEQKQQLADDKVSLKTIAAERDAAAGAPTAEEAARNGTL